MYDVAIVGGGPAGALAANLCGLYGLSAVAFDREADVYDLPRAVGMWDDVQRIVDRAGLLEPFLPATCTHAGAEFSDAEGNRLSGIDLPDGLVTPNGQPPLRAFSQPEFERIIRSGLARFGDVALRVAHAVESIEQSSEAVTVRVRDLGNDDVQTVQARWALGADGASSFVRKSCDIAWNSLGYDHEWLVVDVELLSDRRLSKHCIQYCDPKRPVTMLPLPLGMHRWEFQLRPGETRAEMERPERVWELLEPWAAPRDARIVRAVVYRFHATIADRFRDGRVFLVGDAAHQTPPFLGQGLCTGMRDVDNLVWKLAHVRAGMADDELLDSYSAERHPMAVAMVRHSVNTGRLIDAWAQMAAGGPEPSDELKEYAYGGRAQLPHLTTGLLADPDDPWVGQLFPQGDVATDDERGPFDTLVGRRWALVSAGDPRDGMSSETRTYWEKLGAAFVSVPDAAGPMLALSLADTSFVVRPDRIIYAAAHGALDVTVPGVNPRN